MPLMMWFTTSSVNTKTNLWSVSLALFSMILASGWVIYVAHDKYASEETSSYPAKKISSRDAIRDWAVVSDIYRKESGKRITVDTAHDMLESNRVLNLTSKVPESKVFSNPSLVVYEKYTLKGKILARVRTNKASPNYLDIKTKYGNVRVYYLYTLPFEVKGEEVEVTGITLGRGTVKGPLIMISENKYTKRP